jgi:hypothetical protein
LIITLSHNYRIVDIILLTSHYLHHIVYITLFISYCLYHVIYITLLTHNSLVEELSEDTTFPAADLAAAVASKCFYHLQGNISALYCLLTAALNQSISMLNYSVFIYFSVILSTFVEFCSLMHGYIYFYLYLSLFCYTTIIGVEYNDALRLALCAGQYLDISTKSEYVDTIIAKCIDEYKGQRELQEADPTVRYGVL